MPITNKKATTESKKLKSILSDDKTWKYITLILILIIAINQIFDISINPKLLRNEPIEETSVKQEPSKDTAINVKAIQNEVLPSNGVILPIKWESLGQKMVTDGVIDEKKFRALINNGLSNTEEEMLSGNVNKPIVMNLENSRYILDMLWAFGLSNKNDILDNGEMTDKKYGGDASKFASTGGWSLAKGSGASHYSKHVYIKLTEKQQSLVDEVSRNIYRPCCGNSTHFPDCNHGMAMLGLLELMAANGTSKEDMYNVALKVNSLWFPQTYIDLATYFKEQGKNWDNIDAKTVLGAEYSSARGYQETRQKIKSIPKPQSGGGGCGV